MSDIESKDVESTKAWLKEMSSMPKPKLTRREFFASIFDEIAYLLDNKGYTYKDIAISLKEKAGIEITPEALKVHITQIRKSRRNGVAQGLQEAPEKRGRTGYTFVRLPDEF